MKNKFKYDYNNKLFFINLFLSIIFLIFSFVFSNKMLAFIFLLLMTLFLFFNSFFIIRAQGIKINNKTKKIIIVDQLLIRKISIKDIGYVSLNQIPKQTKSKIYGFLNEFFYPNTYMSHCDYVYNQGKVYNVCFHMKDGTILESYFGWLYREKEKTVKKVETKLLNLIEKINILCRENQKN